MISSSFSYFISLWLCAVSISGRISFPNSYFCGIAYVSKMCVPAQPCWESNQCVQCVIGLSTQIVYGKTFFDLYTFVKVMQP